MHLVHHQLRVSARTLVELSDEKDAQSWISELIERINMEPLYGPVAIYYDEMEGNIGMTAFAIIKTSHIVLHTWNEEHPYRFELDIYSCAEFSVMDVLNLIDEYFNIQEAKWIFDDRELSRDWWNTWKPQ